MENRDFCPKNPKGLDFEANPRFNGLGSGGGPLKTEVGEMRLLSLVEVREILNLGKYSLARLIESNRLRTVKIGHRRLVSMRALREYLDELEDKARKDGNYG
jgi:excisionase family DNA binding protein